MSALSEMVVRNSEEPLPEVLPGIVACDGNDSFELLKELKEKNNLEDEEIYIYYGRHADNISKNVAGCDDREKQYALYCPAVFVFNIEKLKLKNSYPFNPESFNPKDKRIKMNDYELGVPIENIQKYISCVYGSNDSYWKGAVDDGKIKDSREMVNLTAMQKISFDTRLSTVTMLVERIKLLQEYLECIIIPEKLLVYKEFETIQSSETLRIITYETDIVEHPSVYNLLVGNMCKDYMKNRAGARTEE